MTNPTPAIWQGQLGAVHLPPAFVFAMRLLVGLRGYRRTYQTAAGIAGSARAQVR